MKPVIETESTLTDRYQTTVPAPVRQALRLGKRDRIHYQVMEGGAVLITRAEHAGETGDPALLPFLGFLAQDLRTHPERLRAVPVALARRLQRLVSDAQLDLDAQLNPDDE